MIGFLFGNSIFIEYPNGVFFIPFIVWLFYKHLMIEEKKESVKISFFLSFISVVIGFSIGLLPTAWYNQKAYGNPMQLSGTLRNIRSLEEATGSGVLKSSVITGERRSPLAFFNVDRIPKGADVLVASQDRGIIFFSPIILLGLLGLVPMRKKNMVGTTVLISGVSVLFILYCMWGDPWGGWAFGTRYLIPAFGMLAIPLGVAVDKYGKRFLFGLIFLLTLGYSVYINVSGALTTNQIPPSFEKESWVLPRPTFLYNMKIVDQGISSSYVYSEFFSNSISLIDFMMTLYILVMVLAVILYMLSIRKARKNETV
jgi:hypothetical protein